MPKTKTAPCARCRERIATLEAEIARLKEELAEREGDVAWCERELLLAYCPSLQPKGTKVNGVPPPAGGRKIAARK